MTATLKFDEAKHEYSIGDRVIPGVTNVIKAAGMMDFHGDATEAMDRGRAVHMICQLHDEGKLDPKRVPGDLRGYLAAWVKFRIEANVENVEQRYVLLAANGGSYAGRTDGIVSFRDKIERHILDIKSGIPVQWHRRQTAAYRKTALANDIITSMTRYAVYLRKNGTFRLVEHDNYLYDIAVFEAALLINDCKENGR